MLSIIYRLKLSFRSTFLSYVIYMRRRKLFDSTLYIFVTVVFSCFSLKIKHYSLNFKTLLVKFQQLLKLLIIHDNTIKTSL
jgi:hypothetical protein